MTTTKEKKERDMQENSDADFHGAAIIDSEGHEIPITEEMVQQACEDLEQSRKKP